MGDSLHLLLRNRLESVPAAVCGSIGWPVHVVLGCDVVICFCICALMAVQQRDTKLLRRVTPRLANYCLHLSGLSKKMYTDSEVQALVRRFSWLKDYADDVTVHPVWQDDLQWGWTNTNG